MFPSVPNAEVFLVRYPDVLCCPQGECSEEHVCLPLFAFARKEDADKLEAIADEVLGTEEEGPPSR